MSDEAESKNKIAVCAVIFSPALCGLVGLILALVGLKKYPVGSKNRLLCIIALCVGGAMFLLEAIGAAIFFSQPSADFRTFINNRVNPYVIWQESSHYRVSRQFVTKRENKKDEVWSNKEN